MASSDENPAATADQPADDDNKSGGAPSGDAASGKPQKKTMIGLGKLRESLKKSSSSKKSTSLRIPKPSSKRKKKSTQLGLPRPGQAKDDPSDAADKERKTINLTPGDGEDDGPPTDRVGEVPEDTFDEVEPDTDRIDSEAVDEAEPDTDRIEADEIELDGSMIEDVELDDVDDEFDDEMEAEATMLTESPLEGGPAGGFGAEPASSSAEEFEGEAFEGEATMVTDSPLSDGGPVDRESPDDLGAQDDFGGDATMVTDSPLPPEGGKLDRGRDGAQKSDEQASAGSGEFDGVAKTMVTAPGSLPGDEPSSDSQTSRDDIPRRKRRKTNPNPPTPEQRPRPNAADASASIPAVQREARLEDDLDASDDDFHAEKTEVFDSPYENEALVPRLSALKGPAAGQEFLLNKQRNTIGRGKNNTIMVSDLAMSRQHLEITQTNDHTYLVIDLQSANGTRLNNTSIIEAELMHGDRIEAGKTEFQFVIPGNQPQARSQNRHLVPRRESSEPVNRTMVRQMGGKDAEGDETTDKILTYIIIGAGVLSIFLIGAAAYLFLNDPGAKKASAQTAAAPVENSRAQKLYLEGVEKVKDRDWDAAKKLFVQVKDLDAKFSGVDAQLERVEREKQAQRTLAEASTLLDDGEDEKAAATADKISNESVYFDDAQQLIRKARQQRIARLYQKAQQAVTDEEEDEAKKYLAAILDEVPNHKGALELQKALNGEEDDAQDDEPSQDDDSGGHASASASHRGSSSSGDDWLTGGSGGSRSSGGSHTSINFTKGFTLYKASKFDQAASYFSNAAAGGSGPLASRARTTAKDIERFASVYQRGSRALDAGAWKTAIDALGDAKRADRKVARTGYFRPEINAKLATAYAKIGLGDFARGKYSSAYQNYSKARKYDRSNSTGNALRRKLSNKARSLYIQAANKRKTDPATAAKLCRQIVSMVPSSHSMHQKAKKMLSTL